jgi:hypothetical protein
MVWHGFVHLITQIPADAEEVGGYTQNLVFGADALEEHDQPEGEKTMWSTDGRPTPGT